MDQVTATLIGVGVGAAVGLGSAILNNRLGIEAESRKNARVDEGVRRQVRALLKTAVPFVRIGYREGWVDGKKLSVLASDIKQRFSMPDVAISLSDQQASAVFEFVHELGITAANHTALNNEWWNFIAESQNMQNLPRTDQRSINMAARMRGNFLASYQTLKAALGAMDMASEQESLEKP